jgi:hypothetical protein
MHRILIMFFTLLMFLYSSLEALRLFSGFANMVSALKIYLYVTTILFENVSSRSGIDF